MWDAARMKQSWKAGALVALGAAAGGGALAVASVPDGGGVIHACVNMTTSATGTTVPKTTTSNVTIIDPSAGQHCIPPDNPVPNQSPVSWNVTGPPGRAGANGAPGAKGATGRTGPGGSYVVKLAPPKVKSTAATLGHVTLGSGRAALKVPFLAYTGEQVAAAKVSLKDFTITKKLDKSSPKLFLAATRGKGYPTATLVLKKKPRKAGSGQKDFFVITMKEVIITSVSAQSPGATPLETITFTFAKSRIVSG